MNKALGVDISKYQFSADGARKPDFGRVKQTCAFIAIRAGISWGYQDPWFRYSWENVKGFPRMAYFVPYFGEDPVKQMDNFFKIVHDGDWTHDRLVLDNEVQHTNSKATITDCTRRMMEICKQRTGRYPIIYTRANWANQYMNVATLPKTDWWLAQYLFARPYPLYTPEHPGPPTLPKGVDNWLIHQTGEKYSGKEVGVVSYYVDSNRWNGDVAKVLEYFNIGNEPPPPVLTLEQRVTDLERRVSILEAK
jgi:GH25 family lysozyme M1 (1,4-beta-N-acetylmuramidase)